MGMNDAVQNLQVLGVEVMHPFPLKLLEHALRRTLSLCLRKMRIIAELSAKTTLLSSSRTGFCLTYPDPELSIESARWAQLVTYIILLTS